MLFLYAVGLRLVLLDLYFVWSVGWDQDLIMVSILFSSWLFPLFPFTLWYLLVIKGYINNRTQTKLVTSIKYTEAWKTQGEQVVRDSLSQRHLHLMLAVVLEKLTQTPSERAKKLITKLKFLVKIDLPDWIVLYAGNSFVSYTVSLNTYTLEHVDVRLPLLHMCSFTAPCSCHR